MKIRPVAAGVFHADGRTGRGTDMKKLVAAFRTFANAPKKPVKIVRHGYTAVSLFTFLIQQ
jgi:hypothetical protein